MYLIKKKIPKSNHTKLIRSFKKKSLKAVCRRIKSNLIHENILDFYQACEKAPHDLMKNIITWMESNNGFWAIGTQLIVCYTISTKHIWF